LKEYIAKNIPRPQGKGLYDVWRTIALTFDANTYLL